MCGTNLGICASQLPSQSAETCRVHVAKQFVWDYSGEDSVAYIGAIQYELYREERFLLLTVTVLLLFCLFWFKPLSQTRGGRNAACQASDHQCLSVMLCLQWQAAAFNPLFTHDALYCCWL